MGNKPGFEASAEAALGGQPTMSAVDNSDSLLQQEQDIACADAVEIEVPGEPGIDVLDANEASSVDGAGDSGAPSDDGSAAPETGAEASVAVAPVQEQSQSVPVRETTEVEVVQEDADARPPPLTLETNNTHEKTAVESTVTTSKVPDDLGSAGRGAHVDVSVFKYQPGVQAPVENLQSYRINLRGAALTGGVEESVYRLAAGSIDIAAEYERRKGLAVDRHHIKDHRAKQLLVVPNDDKFVAVAAPEAFSRHSGTCMILGGQGAYGTGNTKSYELKLGNFLRIGSVGVVVSEIHTGVGGQHMCLSWEELTCLKGDIAAMQKDLVTIEALTAQEESADAEKAEVAAQAAAGTPAGSPEIKPKEKETRMCYMCFDDVDSVENPLVAPCECKGDTRYVHLNCLQKWHTTTSENKVCVVLNNKGVRVCTVCKSPYKASVRLPDGNSVSLFQSPLPPPYICFMVVTKHQNNEDLFSTKYQLSFSSVINRSGTSSTRGLVVGRSRQCDMVLDYRTVSTRHATIRYTNGRFYFSDLMSSNGSYLYLREPLQLPYGETVYLKWGSNVVSLKAKRSIRHRISNMVPRRNSFSGRGTNQSLSDFTMLEELCEMGQTTTELLPLANANGQTAAGQTADNAV